MSVRHFFNTLFQLAKITEEQLIIITGFRNILIVSLSLTFIIFMVSVLVTSFSQGLTPKNFCLSSECIIVFRDSFQGSIYIFNNGIKIIGASTAIFGVYIALRNYLISVKSSALSGHISYMKLFQEYLVSEIARRDKLSTPKIDIFLWYKNIFPNSVNGDMKISPTYIESIESIANSIRDTHHSLTTPGEIYVSARESAPSICGPAPTH